MNRSWLLPSLATLFFCQTLSAVASAAPAHPICDDLGPTLGVGVSHYSSASDWAENASKEHGVDWRFLYWYLVATEDSPEAVSSWIKGNLEIARSVDAIPVFTFYQLLDLGKMEGLTGTEPEVVEAVLQDASIMSAYFERFTAVLEAVSGEGPVIVQVEPDSWGFMIWAMGVEGNDDATSVPVEVAGSGHPDVAAFPDHAGGLGQALLALRDKVAPNVRLGWHASNFRAGQGADAVASFYASMGDWDVLFSEHPHFEDDPATWWLPWNEARIETNLGFIATLTGKAGVPLLLWQEVIGTTDFHLFGADAGLRQRFAEAGVGGVMFSLSGSGNPDSFRADDVAFAGVPPGDTMAGGTAADLRARLAAYSADPLAWGASALCGGSSASSGGGTTGGSMAGGSGQGSSASGGAGAGGSAANPRSSNPGEAGGCAILPGPTGASSAWLIVLSALLCARRSLRAKALSSALAISLLACGDGSGDTGGVGGSGGDAATGGSGDPLPHEPIRGWPKSNACSWNGSWSPSGSDFPVPGLFDDEYGDGHPGEGNEPTPILPPGAWDWMDAGNDLANFRNFEGSIGHFEQVDDGAGHACGWRLVANTPDAVEYTGPAAYFEGSSGADILNLGARGTIASFGDVGLGDGPDVLVFNHAYSLDFRTGSSETGSAHDDDLVVAGCDENSDGSWDLTTMTIHTGPGADWVFVRDWDRAAIDLGNGEGGKTSVDDPEDGDDLIVIRGNAHDFRVFGGHGNDTFVWYVDENVQTTVWLGPNFFGGGSAESAIWDDPGTDRLVLVVPASTEVVNADHTETQKGQLRIWAAEGQLVEDAPTVGDPYARYCLDCGTGPGGKRTLLFEYVSADGAVSTGEFGVTAVEELQVGVGDEARVYKLDTVTGAAVLDGSLELVEPPSWPEKYCAGTSM